MKVIKINPFDKTVEEVVLSDPHSLSEIYTLLSDEERGIVVDMFDVFRFGGQIDDVIYIDDEGLFKENQAFYRIGTIPLAGIGLIVGTDNQGGTIAPAISVEHVRYLFDRNVFSWVETSDQGMQELRDMNEAGAKRMEAAGLKVERTEFGFLASGPIGAP